MGLSWGASSPSAFSCFYILCETTNSMENGVGWMEAKSVVQNWGILIIMLQAPLLSAFPQVLLPR